MKSTRAPLHQNQAGLVSIMVTVLVMLIISLIVLAFARIVRREQRQALDRQLSTQAFYAAEAGINDASKVIKEAAVVGTAVVAKTDCQPGGNFPGPYVIDAATDVEYTCLLVDPAPLTLVYDNISTSASTIIPIQAASGTFETITFSWQEKGKAAPFTAGGCLPAGKFPPDWPANCNAGVLRVDLVPTDGPLTRDGLVASAMTAFMYPKAGGVGSLAYGSAVGFGGQGAVPEANCSTAGARFCKLTITGLGANSYTIRVKSIYKASTLTISATAGGSPTAIIGAQAVIDSTGRANDVLRRVQVRAPIGSRSNELLPEYALQSADTICKRFSAIPGISPPLAAVPDFPGPGGACNLD